MSLHRFAASANSFERKTSSSTILPNVCTTCRDTQHNLSTIIEVGRTKDIFLELHYEMRVCPSACGIQEECQNPNRVGSVQIQTVPSRRMRRVPETNHKTTSHLKHGAQDCRCCLFLDSSFASDLPIRIGKHSLCLCQGCAPPQKRDPFRMAAEKQKRFFWRTRHIITFFPILQRDPRDSRDHDPSFRLTPSFHHKRIR